MELLCGRLTLRKADSIALPSLSPFRKRHPQRLGVFLKIVINDGERNAAFGICETQAGAPLRRVLVTVGHRAPRRAASIREAWSSDCWVSCNRFGKVGTSLKSLAENRVSFIG